MQWPRSSRFVGMAAILGVCVVSVVDGATDRPFGRDSAAFPLSGMATQVEERARADKLFSKESQMFAPTLSVTQAETQVSADKLEYDRASGWVEAAGHVVVQRGADEVRADYIRINQKTRDFIAYGDVTIRQGTSTWRGEKWEGNLSRMSITVQDVVVQSGPFLLRGRKGESPSREMFTFRQATMTTCSNGVDDAHYHVNASKVLVKRGEYAKGYNTVWFFGPVPVMYVPYWYRTYSDQLGFQFEPGYSSHMGFFLLSAVSYRLTPYLKAWTHVDYRSERGVGVGQDLRWGQRGSGSWYDVSVYSINDRKPFEDHETAAESEIDSERYRLRLQLNQVVSPTVSMMGQAQYLSDAYVLDDFFEKEYRQAKQPENYLALTHRGVVVSSSATLRGRINDFYSDINRLPELSLSVNRQQVGSSPFYYESGTVGGYLERVWATSVTNLSDYSEVRLDSSHMVYWPTKWFGFLSLNPRAGYRATYFSDTMVTNGLETVSGPSTVRSRTEVGLEASVKAFRTWENVGSGLRHIVEPYVNYTYVPEPNVLPAELYEFDSVDRLTQVHQVRLGLRNKLQTRVDESVFNLFDLNVYTYYNLETEAEQDAVDLVYLESVIQVPAFGRANLDGRYSVTEGLLKVFNAQVQVLETELATLQLDYLYRDAESSLLGCALTLMPKATVSLELYGRYEFEQSRVEEQWAILKRTLDCMVVRSGIGFLPGYERDDGTVRDDEWRVALEMWLTAFPDVRVNSTIRD